MGRLRILNQSLHPGMLIQYATKGNLCKKERLGMGRLRLLNQSLHPGVLLHPNDLKLTALHLFVYMYNQRKLYHICLGTSQSFMEGF